jgi:hypothetical protein
LDRKKNLTISDTCGDGRAKDAAVAIGNWVFIFNQLTTTLKSFANSRRAGEGPLSGAKLTMIVGSMDVRLMIDRVEKLLLVNGRKR